MPSDLTLIQSDELIAELVKRYDALVVTGIKFTKTNGDYVTLRVKHGNRYMCDGLMSVFKMMIAQEELNCQYIIPDNKRGDS